MSFITRKLSNVLGVMISGAILTACGSSGGSVDPMELFSNSNSFPQLEAIVPQTNAFASLSSGFSSSNPYWIFTGGTAFGGNYLSPAKGIVSEIGTTNLNGTPLTFVTLIHSGRLATRVYGMQIVNVRPGDSVGTSQIIGNFVTGGQVGFQVILDGRAVCPLSFMSSAFRQYLQTTVFSSATVGTVCAP